MEVYNINAIVFLVKSFKDIVDSYGRVNKTVELYKRQVEYMVQQGQVNNRDKEIVYELLGIVHTNNIKWSIADNKVSQFISAMTFTSDIRDNNSKIAMINKLVSNNSISESVADIIKKIYK